MKSKVRKLFFIGKREDWGRGNGGEGMEIRSVGIRTWELVSLNSMKNK